MVGDVDAQFPHPILLGSAVLNSGVTQWLVVEAAVVCC